MKVWATAGFRSDLSMASGSLARAAVGFVDRVVWVRQVSQRTQHQRPARRVPCAEL
jgi:hypothetical protein